MSLALCVWEGGSTVPRNILYFLRKNRKDIYTPNYSTGDLLSNKHVRKGCMYHVKLQHSDFKIGPLLLMLLIPQCILKNVALSGIFF